VLERPHALEKKRLAVSSPILLYRRGRKWGKATGLQKIVVGTGKERVSWENINGKPLDGKKQNGFQLPKFLRFFFR